MSLLEAVSLAREYVTLRGKATRSLWVPVGSYRYSTLRESVTGGIRAGTYSVRGIDRVSRV